MNDKATVIQFDKVSKRYILQKQKTFKEFLPALLSNAPISKQFLALDNISFDVSKGDSLGILGKNGSGKSTILKLIAGVTQPTSGNIFVSGTIAPLIELGAGFHPELTGRENIYLNASILGISRKEVDQLYPSIVSFAELEEFMNEPIKHYSSGMYMRLAFAVAVAKVPDILLVDEILAVGDIKFQKKCLKRMNEFKKSGTTMIMVNHNIDHIKNHCSHGLVLDNGRQVYFGPIEKAVASYEKLLG